MILVSPRMNALGAAIPKVANNNQLSDILSFEQQASKTMLDNNYAMSNMQDCVANNLFPTNNNLQNYLLNNSNQEATISNHNMVNHHHQPQLSSPINRANTTAAAFMDNRPITPSDAGHIKSQRSNLNPNAPDFASRSNKDV